MTTSTWSTQPASGEWNTTTNWEPAAVPTDTANFIKSSQTTITFSPTKGSTVNNIEFAADAPAYTFTFNAPSPDTPSLTIAGPGITNNSTSPQSFIVAAPSSGYEKPQLKFINSASAGGSDMYYCAGPATKQGFGGGVIRFCNTSTAGSASFKAWTGAGTPPRHNSTVGGEISFGDSSSADNASFTIYGTLSETDGDTFGNTVFHDSSTAANATFKNVGGTVSGGDGGNTQFYDNSTAANGVFNNWGGTHSEANGGDVAFDGTANGGHGYYYNYAAPAAGAYGGVTSFNNNPPEVKQGGATAGNGFYFNFGAREGELGGGGHIEFSAKHGSPTAASASFNNYGSTIADKSSAGHTIFSINLPTDYYPNAGNGTFWNHPGLAKGGAAGFTEFSVYQSKEDDSNTATTGPDKVPSAGDGTFINLGAYTSGTVGGYTVFSGTSSADNALLIAQGGSHGGDGGRIVFYEKASGGKASIQLFGNGELAIGDHTNGLTIGSLDLTGGIISIQLGTKVTGLTLSRELILKSNHASFSFWNNHDGGFEFNTAYTILTTPNLSRFKEDQFKGNNIEGVEPTFSIVGNDLQVSFNKN